MPAKKIVLSDDAVLMAILEHSFFKREGFQLLQITDAETSFQLVEQEAPALVVLDLSQLGEQAYTCCRSIKDDPLLAKTPVLLLLSEQDEDEVADECWDAGCDAVVHRPLRAERFLDAACGLLGISRRLDRRFPISFSLAFLDQKQKKHVGSCVNLNSGGLFLATETLFPVETQLEIEFTLPGYESALSCPVRVAWVNHPEWRKKNALPCGMGLEFVASNQTLKVVLNEFVDSLKLED
jgi:DNA-binding response OmpR family regulator